MSNVKSQPTMCANVKSLSMSQCDELVKSGVCERFLRRFAADYIPSAKEFWAPARLMERDLLELTKRSSNVSVTYNGDENQKISGLSFAESSLMKTKLKDGEISRQVQYFGSSLDDLVQHAVAHLYHVVTITDGRTVNFVLNFPTCIDQDAASTAISKHVTHGPKSEVTGGNGYLLYLKRNPMSHASATKSNL